jgi:hypothetical protein
MYETWIGQLVGNLYWLRSSSKQSHVVVEDLAIQVYLT